MTSIRTYVVFKLVEDLHVIVEPLPTEAALAKLGGTDHGLRLDPRVQRGELCHLVEGEFRCIWQKLCCVPSRKRYEKDNCQMMLDMKRNFYKCISHMTPDMPIERTL